MDPWVTDTPTRLEGRHISVCVDVEEELILPIYYLLPS